MRHSEGEIQMKIIFIRHAEPDYTIDSLTEKGRREAELLSERAVKWKVTDFYCSPLGRARATAEPTLRKAGREAKICDWLQEFLIPSYETGENILLWDLMPETLDGSRALFSPGEWLKAEVMKKGPTEKYYRRVTLEFDRILNKYGYERNGVYYRSGKKDVSSNHYMVYDGHTTEHMKNCKVDDTTIVCFCHLGVMLLLISYLINSTPSTLWQGIFVPPSSVTVLSSEEREPGKAYFRCQMIGDTSHLRFAGEPVSYYGYFAPPFQG